MEQLHRMLGAVPSAEPPAGEAGLGADAKASAGGEGEADKADEEAAGGAACQAAQLSALASKVGCVDDDRRSGSQDAAHGAVSRTLKHGGCCRCPICEG
jgi:hypothetical protein